MRFYARVIRGRLVATPALVLMHGGAHAADCWDLTVDEIHRCAPDITVVAVDLPGRRGKPGSARVRELVFAAAFLPPDGRSLMDTVPGPLGWYGRRMVHKRAAGRLPKALGTYAFCNGMTPEQRRFTQVRWYPEAAFVVVENVDRSAMPRDVRGPGS